jgi:hypothetical protein
MPKETVQFPSTDGYVGTELSVHWSKEEGFPLSGPGGGYVQIAATRHVWKQQPPPEPGALCSNIPDKHADHSHCAACADAVEDNEKRKKSGQPQAYWGNSGSDAPPVGEFDPPATVFSEPLTRPQINSLIRVLRRARDAALGADA